MTVARDEPLDGLVDAVRRGDRDAIAAVYLEVAPALLGFLRRRVPYGEVAEDLLEQTFVELIEGCDRIRGDGRSLRAWLFRAARNNLHDWRKRAERRGDHELAARHTATLADSEADPGEQIAAAELDPGIVAALRELTDDQRDVMELRLVAGLSLAQVADITGRKVGAVKALQHRAVQRLVTMLASEDQDPT